jgi:hypothetical protein
MTIWVRFAINAALAAVVSLLQNAATTEAHKAKIAAFIAAAQDLLNNW